MLIALDQLDSHPANANVMPARLLLKLESHIRATGRCPPLIVRPLAGSDQQSAVGDRPASAGAGLTPLPLPRYQILDGHHRALVLRRLGRSHAECDVWTGIGDRQAALLLLTLNSLHGEDDPMRRGALLRDLQRDHCLPADTLAGLLPDDADRIARLIELAAARAPAMVDPHALPDPASMPQAVTFFLTGAQRERLLQRLREVDRDRSAALLKALNLHA